MQKYTSEIALVVANLIPLLGIWLFGWEVSTLLIIYWAETAVIGFYTFLKLTQAPIDLTTSQRVNVLKRFDRYFALFTFAFKLGGAMFIHGLSLLILFSEAGLIPVLDSSGILLVIAGFMISHGISHYRNFIHGEEYKHYSTDELMKLPYRRMAVMQMVVLLSGSVLILLESSQISILILFVVIKIIFDLRAHRKEHAAVQ